MNARDRILAFAATPKAKAIEVPALGGTVHIRPMSVAGMARINAEKDQSQRAVIMLADCLCDENGVRLFTQQDEAALLGLPGLAVTKLMQELQGISGLGDGDQEAAAGE